MVMRRRTVNVSIHALRKRRAREQRGRSVTPRVSTCFNALRKGERLDDPIVKMRSCELTTPSGKRRADMVRGEDDPKFPKVHN